VRALRPRNGARDQLTVVVLLYRALGGGWNLDDPRWVPPSAAAVVPRALSLAER
jgi:hypothetical protein